MCLCAFVKKFNTIIKRYFAINNVVVFKEFITVVVNLYQLDFYTDKYYHETLAR